MQRVRLDSHRVEDSNENNADSRSFEDPKTCTKLAIFFLNKNLKVKTPLLPLKSFKKNKLNAHSLTRNAANKDKDKKKTMNQRSLIIILDIK